MPWFSHKENIFSLVQAGDRLSDLSQSPRATGFRRAIISIVWTELQCDRRLLGGQNEMKTCMRVPVHQTISDSFWCRSTLQGSFLWAFLSIKCFCLFSSICSFLSHFPSWLGSTNRKAGKPHCWQCPRPCPTRGMWKVRAWRSRSGRPGWISVCYSLARWATGQIT